MSRKSGYRFSEEDMRQRNRMSKSAFTRVYDALWKSGYKKDMRQR